jgi:hypothetical protein
MLLNLLLLSLPFLPPSPLVHFFLLLLLQFSSCTIHFLL